MNANIIIASALRKLLVVSTGRTPTTDQFTVGLELLNDIVRLWSAEINLVYEDTTEEIPLTENTQSFTIGATGDFVSVRPLKITHASLVEVTTEYLLRISDTTRYQNVRDKAVTGLPYMLYYRHTFPNTEISFDKKIDRPYRLLLTSFKELVEFPDGTTEVSLPSYYETAFKDALTIAIAPEMGASKRLTPLMIRSAERSEAAIIALTIDLNESITELGRRTGYNIEGDTY